MSLVFFPGAGLTHTHIPRQRKNKRSASELQHSGGSAAKAGIRVTIRAVKRAATGAPAKRRSRGAGLTAPARIVPLRRSYEHIKSEMSSLRHFSEHRVDHFD